MRSLTMWKVVNKVVFDYAKLRGKIKEVFGTQAKFAKKNEYVNRDIIRKTELFSSVHCT